ncbi:hypothetical protein K439DRAFT_995974 [Ramaria rubella]|nr:hypothetical protein K439DRAFT_995974 [Ramaria rubella]
MPTWKTYFKALAMAVIIYPQGISSSTVKKTPGIFVEGEMSGPLPSDGNAVWCPKASWNLVEVNQQEQSPATVFTESAVPSFTSKMHFSIPVSSDLVFFTSRGSYDHDSSITVELSDTSGNDIEIDVVLGYYNNAALERANVCLLERNGGGKGVGFFVNLAYVAPAEL